MNRLGTLSSAALLLAAPLVAGAAESDEAPTDAAGSSAFLNKSFRATLSGYPAEVDGTVRIDPEGGRGTTLELDRDFNLGDSNWLPRLDLVWRITPHHRLDFSYYQLERDGSRSFQEQVVFGEQTFDVNASLNADMTARIGQVNYGWSFINDGKKEVGVSIGAHIVDVEFELRGQAGGIQAVRTADTLVGAPLLGLYGAYAFTPDLVLGARGQWLKFDWDDYEIELRQAALELDWRFSKYVGANVAYNFYNSDITREGGDFRGDFELELTGPRVGLSFYF